jgi:DNA-binding GntR family transcriptional regulator
MTPKWRELADKLAEQIKRGEYAPGQQLPQIRELVAAGEGSKSTVLRQRGWLRLLAVTEPWCGSECL